MSIICDLLLVSHALGLENLLNSTKIVKLSNSKVILSLDKVMLTVLSRAYLIVGDEYLNFVYS